MDKSVRAFDLYEPLREPHREGLPVYGRAGMIMLADRIAEPRPGQQTLGGLDITVRRNAFGRQVDSFEEDIHFAGLAGPPIRAVFIRAPWVEEVGDGVQCAPGSRTDRPPVRSSRFVRCPARHLLPPGGHR